MARKDFVEDQPMPQALLATAWPVHQFLIVGHRVEGNSSQQREWALTSSATRVSLVPRQGFVEQ
jgi:hypothetical protein